MCRFTARAPPAPLAGRLDDAPEVYDDGFHWFDDAVIDVLEDANQLAPAFPAGSPSSQHGSTQEGIAPGGSAASFASDARPQELDLLALLKEELGVEGNLGLAPSAAPGDGQATAMCDVAGGMADAAAMEEYVDDEFDDIDEDALPRETSTLTSAAHGTPSSQAPAMAVPQGSVPVLSPGALTTGAMPMAPALLPEQLLAMQQQGAAALAAGTPLQIVSLPFAAAAGAPWLGLAQAQAAAAAAAAAVARTVRPSASHGSAAAQPLPLHPCKASRSAHDQEALVERVKQKRRESAQRSRARKNAYMKALEAENSAMKEELARVKGLLASMQAAGAGMAVPLKQDPTLAQA